MTPRDREMIKILQKHHFSADNIANNMNTTVEQVCDILGWSMDERDATHRDYNFYEFGVDNKMEYYGLFLQEGDFEKWQPVCYMDHDSVQYKELLAEVRAIPETNNDRSEARRFWIFMRFQKYQTKEWGMYRNRFLDHANICDDINIKRRKDVPPAARRINNKRKKEIQAELK